MFTLDNRTHTRVYQDALQEGKQEGMQQGRQNGLLAIITPPLEKIWHSERFRSECLRLLPNSNH
jgi:predicted transposase YdaD